MPKAPPGEEFTQFADFRRDPEAHPLDTPSGKVEIVSDEIAALNLLRTAPASRVGCRRANPC
jgi:biotin/methionine sulfoxide reductase